MVAPKKEALAAAEAELAVAMAVCCFNESARNLFLNGKRLALRANIYFANLCLGIGEKTCSFARSTRKARKTSGKVRSKCKTKGRIRTSGIMD